MSFPVTHLVDLSNPFPQCFSLPQPIIYSIFESSKLLSTQKLMKSCKTFKLLHLKFGKSDVKKISIFQKHHVFDLGMRPVEYGIRQFIEADGYEYYGPEIVIQAKSIRILDDLELYFCHRDKFEMLMPKLNLSVIREIKVYVKFQIKIEFMETLLQPSLESLQMWLEFQNTTNPAVLAFQRCPNLKNIDIIYGVGHLSKELLTEEDFKKIVCTSRTVKLIGCRLSPVLKINHNDFITFIDNHIDDLHFCESSCEHIININFHENGYENFLDLTSLVKNVTKERKEKGIPMARICLFCGRNNFYTNK